MTDNKKYTVICTECGDDLYNYADNLKIVVDKFKGDGWIILYSQIPNAFYFQKKDKLKGLCPSCQEEVALVDLF